MSKSTKSNISPRKSPAQQRSARLVADVLEAAARVLANHGARHFTTVRVAEEAGVSIGSLYQYFPNKEALLFRLQTDEWTETWSVIEEVLCARESGEPPLDRLRRAVLLFFRSERQEAALRAALDDAGALFRDAPEAQAFEAKARRSLDPFFAEAMPDVAPTKRKLAAELIFTSLGAAEEVTASQLDRASVDAWGRATGDMFSAYIESLNREAARSKRSGASETAKKPARRKAR